MNSAPLPILSLLPNASSYGNNPSSSFGDSASLSRTHSGYDYGVPGPHNDSGNSASQSAALDFSNYSYADDLGFSMPHHHSYTNNHTSNANGNSGSNGNNSNNNGNSSSGGGNNNNGSHGHSNGNNNNSANNSRPQTTHSNSTQSYPHLVQPDFSSQYRHDPTSVMDSRTGGPGDHSAAAAAAAAAARGFVDFDLNQAGPSTFRHTGLYGAGDLHDDTGSYVDNTATPREDSVTGAGLRANGDDTDGADNGTPADGEGDLEGEGEADNEEPLYVNAKQYHRILKRRLARARLEELNRLVRSRKPYLHESRHRHACSRPRGKGGRFLTADEIEQLKREEAAKAAGGDGEDEGEGEGDGDDTRSGAGTQGLASSSASEMGDGQRIDDARKSASGSLHASVSPSA